MKPGSRWTVWLARAFVVALAAPIILVAWLLVGLRFPGWYAFWEGETPVSLALAAALDDADRRLQSGDAARAGDRFVVELDLTRAGIALDGDALCYTREYASVETVGGGLLGRSMTANRAHLGENHALVLVRGDRAHVVAMFNPSSRAFHLRADRRIPLLGSSDGSCAPALSSLVTLSTPVSRHPRASHSAAIELTTKR